MNKVVISKNNIFYDTYLPFSGEVIEDVPSIESIFFLLRYVLLLHKIQGGLITNLSNYYLCGN
jgi:hypothetical protein